MCKRLQETREITVLHDTNCLDESKEMVVCMISRLFSYRKHSRRVEARSHHPMSKVWSEIIFF